MGTNRYLVVSDLHICDVEDFEPDWKRHKRSEWVFDEDFDALVRDFESRHEPGDTLTLVLNGDIFDFDLVTAIPGQPPWPVGRIERLYGLDATAEKSAWKLDRILRDHPVFVRTLARFAGAGHRLVFIMGNHDRELYFPEVQAVYRDAIVAAARDAGDEVAPESLLVEPWFYYVEGEVFIEHGHQYDFYSTFRYNLAPTVERGAVTYLALPMGNLSNRYLLNIIGTFNPHATDFILSLFGYVRHWFRHYAFRRRNLILAWLLGSLRSLFALIGTRKRLRRRPPQDYPERIRAVATRYALEPQVAQEIEDLKMEPITSRIYKIIREFWIDRVLLALAMTGGTVALALSGAPLWVKLTVPLMGFPLTWFLYQWFAGGDNALTVEQSSHKYAHAIAARLPAVRAIVFGHSHVPNTVPISHGTTFANCGTWAPIFQRGEPVRLAQGLRNYVMIAIDGPDCRVDLGSWMPLARRDEASRSMDREQQARR